MLRSKSASAPRRAFGQRDHRGIPASVPGVASAWRRNRPRQVRAQQVRAVWLATHLALRPRFRWALQPRQYRRRPPESCTGIGTSADTRRPAWLDTSGHRRGRWAVAPRERVNGPSATTPIAANAGIRGTASGARPLEFRTADPVTPHHDPYLSFLTFRELSVRLRLAWSKAMQSLFNLDALLAGSGPG
jgi:hypothetical protein